MPGSTAPRPATGPARPRRSHRCRTPPRTGSRPRPGRPRAAPGTPDGRLEGADRLLGRRQGARAPGQPEDLALHRADHVPQRGVERPAPRPGRDDLTRPSTVDTAPAVAQAFRSAASSERLSTARSPVGHAAAHRGSQRWLQRADLARGQELPRVPEVGEVTWLRADRQRSALQSGTPIERRTPATSPGPRRPVPPRLPRPARPRSPARACRRRPASRHAANHDHSRTPRTRRAPRTRRRTGR